MLNIQVNGDKDNLPPFFFVGMGRRRLHIYNRKAPPQGCLGRGIKKPPGPVILTVVVEISGIEPLTS